MFAHSQMIKNIVINFLRTFKQFQGIIQYLYADKILQSNPSDSYQKCLLKFFSPILFFLKSFNLILKFSTLFLFLIRFGSLFPKLAKTSNWIVDLVFEICFDD